MIAAVHGKRLGRDELIKLVGKQILSALGYCHGEHGIIHRDVKPDNILWKWTGNGLCFVLSDFGLARDYPGKLNPNFAADDYYWWPPEYYTKPSRQEPKSDLWMLGLTLLWMVDANKLRTEGKGKPTMSEI